MKRPAILLVFVALSLSGCQSNKISKEEYFAKLDALKGLSEINLIDQRGTPDQILTTGSINIKYFIYNSSLVHSTKNASYCYRTGSLASATCEALYCKEIFKIENNKVSQALAEGNNCL